MGRLRRGSLYLVVFICVCCIFQVAPVESKRSRKQQPQASKPNFVILFADDLGYGDVPFNGHPTIRAPNLLKLSREGMTLTQWYSGAPICTPSRAAMLTGRLPIRSGMDGTQGGVLACDAVGGLPLNETTFAELLKTAGYATGMAGKWHVGQREQYLPTARGFDEWVGPPYSVDMGCPRIPQCTTPIYDIGCFGLPLMNGSDTFQQPLVLEDLSTRYANFSTAFIEQNAKSGTPFVLYMAFSHVHVSVPEMKEYSGPKFVNSSRRGVFGDAVEEMDWVVGEIMTTIVTLGIEQDTLVFFTSDNGPWLDQLVYAGSMGLFQGEYAAEHLGYLDTGKASTWEGGLRVPAVAWWPGQIPRGVISQELTNTMDIFVTMLKLAGVPLPSDRVYDGMDITEVLLHKAPSPHKYLFLYRGLGLFAVRYHAYKVHYYTRSGFGLDQPKWHDPPLIFNVENDPSEAYLLNATAPEYQKLLKEVRDVTRKHNETLDIGADQLIGRDPGYAICCNRDTKCVCG